MANKIPRTGQQTELADAAVVIMAGGSGERFWPVSRRAKPKQLLRLYGEKTLIEQAFDRGARLVGTGRVYIVAGERLRAAIVNALPQFVTENYIAEPMARNTTACLALAASFIERKSGSETVMAVLTADHLIEDGETFYETLKTAIGRAASTDDLVAIGMKPTTPDTGFGYLELGEVLSETGDDKVGKSGPKINRIARFTEKPDLETAEKFVDGGKHLWNSGMFFWRIGVFLDALSRYQPAMAGEMASLRAGAGTWPSGDSLSAIFERLESLPVDKAVMEKADRVSAVVGEFGWEDVGSWESLSRVLERDESDNWSVGPTIAIDATDNIIYNERGEGEPEPPEIVLYGVEGLVVVRTPGAVMITTRARAQEVKKIVSHIKSTGRDDLL